MRPDIGIFALHLRHLPLQIIYDTIGSCKIGDIDAPQLLQQHLENKIGISFPEVSLRILVVANPPILKQIKKKAV